ncbi:DUF4192 family protein [Microbacterium sp. BK668]|uniref:DUF4192 family protein n=1 Tax=Microbacterium sp. BK668 TaxID=2512118 RepID=UPI00105EF5BA|nr:DUF4192 family protein [Microbacterium sp. BK668]TDN90775.1 uncharacterized protein DUF4192 [Microbacterium sp. BK668]
MTTIVKAASAAQFLSLVPRMLGFRPTRSLVVIPFAGSRSLGAMRLDLPDDEADLDAVAATVIGMVCRLPDAEALTAVVYADEAFGERMPRAALATALGYRADECGLRLVDALYVGAEAWGSYLDRDLPAGGRPIEELGDEPPGAAHLAVADGDQSTGAELEASDPREAEAVDGALRGLADAVDLLCGTDAGAAALEDGPRVDPLALSAVCSLDDLPTLFEGMLAWDTADLAPYDIAVVVWCLARPALRDIALVEWCGGLDAGDEAFAAQLRWEAGEEYPAHLAMHMWGEGERPDPERLERALALARRAAAAAPEPLRAGPLATCGWLSWALGRSTHAERYAVQACEIEPEHGLAEIVRSFVHAGHLPDWAFRPR